MKIKLISEISVNNNLDKNQDVIIKNIKEANSGDLLLFSEAFLHGFDALSWDYKTDINIAVEQDSFYIEKIKEHCKDRAVFCGFGYYEKVDKDIYCSYIVINDNGKIINNYRRMSVGWKEYKITTDKYKEGLELIPFKIKGFKAVTIVCGDLWDDKIKCELIGVIKKEKIDFVIWPNHLDYEYTKWEEEMSNDYASRTSDIKIPIFLINDISNSSYGGAVIFKDGKILKKSKIRFPDVLTYQVFFL